MGGSARRAEEGKFDKKTSKNIGKTKAEEEEGENLTGSTSLPSHFQFPGNTWCIWHQCEPRNAMLLCH